MSSDDRDVLLDKTWERLVALAHHADRSFLIRKRMQAARQFATEYPVVTFCFIVFIAMCSVPLLCFLTFAVISTVITFCGFLFIEGVLLAIGTVVLSGSLMIITALTLGFIASVSCVWLGFVGGKYVWMKWCNNSKAWIDQFKYQCWEHASYKEVWQSDRTSDVDDVEDISARNDTSATIKPRVSGGSKTD